MDELNIGASATAPLPPAAVAIKTFSGLANQGATCYMNSLLQTLCVKRRSFDAPPQLPAGRHSRRRTRARARACAPPSPPISPSCIRRETQPAR